MCWEGFLYARLECAMNVSGASSTSAVRAYNANMTYNAMSRIASGKGADSAADVSLSANLSSLISSGDSAGSNMQNAISLLQTSGGYLDSISNDLSMMKKLAVQANGGTLSSSDLDSVKEQFKTLQNDITTVTSNYNASGSFDGTALFQGNNYEVQSGATQGQTTDVQTSDLAVQNNAQIGTADTYTYDSSNVLVGSSHTAVQWGDVINSISGLDVTSKDVLSSIQSAIDYVGKAQTSTGNDIASMAASYGSLSTYDSNLSAALSVNSDVDVSDESMALTKSLVMASSQNAMQTQATSMTNLAMQLSLIG